VPLGRKSDHGKGAVLFEDFSQLVDGIHEGTAPVTRAL
jgi:hypothetical protein